MRARPFASNLADPSHALSAARRAVDLDNGAPAAWNALGLAYRLLGLARDSFAAMAKACELAPDHAALLSNLLLAACYLDEDAERDRQLRARYGALYPARPRPEVVRGARIAIAYLSPDLRHHPTGIFLAPVIEAHDRSRFDITLYAAQSQSDDLTARLAAAAPMRFVGHQSDAALARQIERDGIEVLIDLAGHTANNRLGVLALRPAPIQLIWGGYVGSVGLRAVDGLIADPIEVPDELEQLYDEPIHRLYPDYVAFAPPPVDLPPRHPVAPPAVRFGCFNNILKLSDRCLAIWGRLLARVPAATLLLKGPGFDFAPSQARLRAALMAAGARADQIFFEGPAPSGAFLSAYGRIDLALDPMPYSGGLTTLEALWMGTPVLTCPGRSFTSRHSASHLSALGLEDLIAQNGDDYIARAIALSQDRPRLEAWHQTLRSRMAASPLCDGRHVAAQIEMLAERLLGDVLN